MTSPAHHESSEGLIPSVGARVLAKDGHELGTVKEVHGETFKVDAAMARDYWLNLTHVASCDGGVVALAFDKELLDDYRLEGPDSPTAESPYLDAEADTYSSREEKESRRERSEHPQG